MLISQRNSNALKDILVPIHFDFISESSISRDKVQVAPQPPVDQLPCI